jgi:outer membrane protein insertion porin family
MAEVSWELAGLGGDEKFSKYILDYRHFWPAFLGTVVSAHGQIGYIHTFDNDESPIDERFFLGGINTLRGFDPREVGPRDEFGDYTGGDVEAYGNFEWLVPLGGVMSGVKGVAFFDVGNTWDHNYFSDWRYSTGAGIRWLSPLGPLRLEWGYNLDPKEWEDNSRLDFMIGRFF